jgi:hypothetical protein
MLMLKIKQSFSGKGEESRDIYGHPKYVKD